MKLKGLESIKTKYDGQNAKEMKLTGIHDWYNRTNSVLNSIEDMADKVGKAGDNKITGAMAKVLDHVIRAAASFVESVLWMLAFISEAIVTLITSGFNFIKNLFSKNPIIKEEEKAAKDKKDAEEKKADDEKGGDSDELDEIDEDVKEESSVEEVAEGEEVTQESTVEEAEEESMPVDPAVSAWYSR